MISLEKNHRLYRQTLANGERVVAFSNGGNEQHSSIETGPEGTAYLVRKSGDGFQTFGKTWDAVTGDGARPDYGVWVDSNGDEKVDSVEVTTFEQYVGRTKVAGPVVAVTTDVGVHYAPNGSDFNLVESISVMM